MKLHKSLLMIAVATMAMMVADSNLLAQQQPGAQQRQGGQRQGGGQRPGGFGGFGGGAGMVENYEILVNFGFILFDL